MSTPDKPFQELQCPCCGYLITDLEHELIKCDPPCPRCAACKLSEFIPAHVGPIEKEEGEEWKDNQ